MSNDDAENETKEVVDRKQFKQQRNNKQRKTKEWTHEMADQLLYEHGDD